MHIGTAQFNNFKFLSKIHWLKEFEFLELDSYNILLAIVVYTFECKVFLI